MNSFARPWTRTLITSALIGVGQSVAAILALLPFVLDDAAVPRFIAHVAVAGLVFQVLGCLAAVAVKAPACAPGWIVRGLGVALTAALIWLAGWHESFSLPLGLALLAVHVVTSRWGFVYETVVGLTLVAAASGIAHPLLVHLLVPLALILALAVTLGRVALWSLPAFGAPRRDLATLSVVAGLFAPVVMMVGGWLGHDNALLFSAVLTQFVGLATARRVSYDLISP